MSHCTNCGWSEYKKCPVCGQWCDEERDLKKSLVELKAENKRLKAKNAELQERVAMLDILAVFKSLREIGYIEQVANLKAENIKLKGWVDELLEDYDHPNVALASDIALRLKTDYVEKL